MANNYNIMMYVYEDDRKLSSSFYHDLIGLLNKKNKIPINIIYHSKHFYGSYKINISGIKYISEKIDTIKLQYNLIKKDIEDLYKNNYVKGMKNILYYGGHSEFIYKDKKHNFITDIFENINDIELLIMDSCYSSYTNLLSTLIGKTKYVIACETTSPNFGFIDKNFLYILASSHNYINKYKIIINNFIKRNTATKKEYKNFNYRTDGTLIDMKEYVNIYNYINNNKDTLKKDIKYKIEKCNNYNFYDLNYVTEKKIEETIKKCVIYKKMNNLAKDFFDKHNIVLSGLIIGL